MEKTSDQRCGDLLLGEPTIAEPEVLAGYMGDVERMHSLGHITAFQLERARNAYAATIERDPRQRAPQAQNSVIGGLAGKGVAEMIDPSAEEAYWRANYASRPYVAAGASFDDYGPAFACGVNAYREHPGKAFDEIDSSLAQDWQRAHSTSTLEWGAARLASRDAWLRASRGLSEAQRASGPRAS